MTERKMPNFIIIGAMKAGTTTLYRAMLEHPQIVPAVTKELHFLTKNGVTKEKYIILFNKCEKGQITGEATPNYLWKPLAPKNAKKLIPETKFIALLRNPVYRTYSQYWGYLRKCKKRRKEPKFKTFNKYVKYLIHHPNNQCRLGYVGRYGIQRSIYINQLEEWYKYFPKKQIMIIKSEDLFKDVNKITNEVFSFLGLSPCELKVNYHFLDKKDLNKQFNIKTKKIGIKVKNELKEYFRPFNEKLYKLIDRDMNWEQEI